MTDRHAAAVQRGGTPATARTDGLAVDRERPGRLFVAGGLDAVLLGRTGDGRYAYFHPAGVPSPGGRPIVRHMRPLDARLALGLVDATPRDGRDRRRPWSRR